MEKSKSRKPELHLVAPQARAEDPQPHQFQDRGAFMAALFASRGMNIPASHEQWDGPARELWDESFRLWDEAVAENDRRRRCRAALSELGGILPAADVQLIATDSYEPSRAIELTKDWWNATGNDSAAPTMLVLLGRPDTGKTFAALTWLARRAQGKAAYVKEKELCRLSRATFGDEVERYRDLLGTRRLVVDEVDVHNNDAEIARRAFMDIVDERKGGGRETIIIGNATKAQLMEWRCDDRIASRLRAYARVEVVVDAPRRRDLGYLPPRS